MSNADRAGTEIPRYMTLWPTGRRHESWQPENATWICQGLHSREFYEKYMLPVEVERDQVDAQYDQGILAITLPKAEYAKPKNIKVSVHS